MAPKRPPKSADPADPSLKPVAPNKARPPRLRLGCAPLITGICVIVLLGKVLPHEPRRSAAHAAKPATHKMADSPSKPSPAKPAHSNGAKKPDGIALQEQPVVTDGLWNGTFRQAERALKKRLHDADSFDALAWGPVVENKQGYQVRCTFRAKNVLGIYATQSKTVFLNKAGEIYAIK